MKRYPFLSLADTNAPYLERMKEAAARVIDSGRYIGGPEVERFEKHLAETVQVPHAVGVANGLDALRLILRAYIHLGRLQPGDEVLVPANTYIATFLAISDAGLKPIPVEPSPVTMNIDSTLIEDAVTSKTRAIMPVHLYGRVAWDETMADVVKRHDLLVIEDNAQAIGARATVPGLNGHFPTGSLGHAAAFSFYPTKNIGALGDAGAVTTADPALAATVRALANYGSDRRYHNIMQGFNSRLDPIQAAILDVKLDYLDLENAARFDRAVAYSNNITNPAVGLPLMSSMPTDCVWHQYVITVDPARRDKIRQLLLDRGVETDIHYAVPPHLQPCYAAEFAGVQLPVTERLVNSIISLPIGPGTPITDIVEISHIINVTI
ncbi:MAG: DegT/DnrJ/EryC1/StrS family aminotransferase [Muribaculaceae bacterium]|nr:DegT/DnrJ/EryC1/StrS family aminotransferase [Muribaculaceae bacterium]